MTDAADQAPYWERSMDGETPRQFQAFAVYRDLGITRSLKKAAEVFYAERDDPDEGPRTDPEGTPESSGSGALRRFKRWSSEFSWVARAEAFDAEMARARSLRLQAEREKQLDAHLTLSKLGTKAASQKLWRILQDGGEIPAGSLPSLMTASVQIGRLALGEATERTETQAAEDRPPDFSRLTYEEIVTLDEIRKKLHDGG